MDLIIKKVRKCVNLSAHSSEWTGKNHKVQFTDVAILKREQPVTYRQYLRRVVAHLNKIKFIYKYDTRTEIFFPSHGCGAVDKFPQQLWKRVCAVLGMKEAGMMFHYSLRETSRSHRTLGWLSHCPQLHSRNVV